VSNNPDLSVGKVVRRAFSVNVLAVGKISAQVGAEVRVGSRIPGKVDHLYANIGDIVEKDQVVASLEKEDLTATVDRYQAELRITQSKLSSLTTLHPREIEKAEADMAKWQASVDLNLMELLREEELRKEDIGTPQSLERVQEQYLVARAELAAAEKTLQLLTVRFAEDVTQARADIARAEAMLAGAAATLSFATITAPIPGVIASVSTQEGETVAVGLNAPTFVTIIDLNKLQVDAYVDEVDIGKIKVGQRGMFTVDAFSDKDFEGIVTAIYPKAVIQNNVIYYDVVIDITSDYKNLLRPEMTAHVTIFLDKRADVLAVPARAVKRQNGSNIVYIVRDGEPEPVEIRTGWRDGQWVEILDRLEEGESVLLELPSEDTN